MQPVRGNDLTHHLPDMPLEPGIRFALGSNGVRNACPKLLGEMAYRTIGDEQRSGGGDRRFAAAASAEVSNIFPEGVTDAQTAAVEAAAAEASPTAEAMPAAALAAEAPAPMVSAGPEEIRARSWCAPTRARSRYAPTRGGAGGDGPGRGGARREERARGGAG